MGWREDNQYPNDYIERPPKDAGQTPENRGETEKKQGKGQLIPAALICGVIVALLIFLVVVLGTSANQFTDWLAEQAEAVSDSVREHKARAEEKKRQEEEQRKEEERRRQQEEQEQELEEKPTYDYGEEPEYYELADAIREDLSYQVQLQQERIEEASDDELLYTIHGQYPVISGDGVANLDYLNEMLYSEYDAVKEYFDENADLVSEESGPLIADFTCYVTYMDEERLSVVYDERIYISDYYMDVYLYAINIDMENGVVLSNPDILYMDDDFAIEFRNRNAEQNQTDVIDYMSDQEVTSYLNNEKTCIAFYTPLGMEIGINHDSGWITVTYKDYEKYLKIL